MAKASRKKRMKRSAVKRRSNPSTGAILALVALGAAAAGGAWWFFSKKGSGRSLLTAQELSKVPLSSLSLAQATAALRTGAGGMKRTGEAAASEAPARGASGVGAPGGVPGVGGLPGIGGPTVGGA